MGKILNGLVEREDFFHFFCCSLCILSFMLFCICTENYSAACNAFTTFTIPFSWRIKEIAYELGKERKWEEKENTTLFYKVVKQFNEKYYFIYCSFIVFFFILPYFRFLSNQSIVVLSFFILMAMWIQIGIIYIQVKKEEKRLKKEREKRWIQEIIKMNKAMMERRICDTED